MFSYSNVFSFYFKKDCWTSTLCAKMCLAAGYIARENAPYRPILECVLLLESAPLLECVLLGLLEVHCARKCALSPATRRWVPLYRRSPQVQGGREAGREGGREREERGSDVCNNCSHLTSSQEKMFYTSWHSVLYQPTGIQALCWGGGEFFDNH